MENGKEDFRLIAWMASIYYKNGIICIEFNNKFQDVIMNWAKEKGYTKYFIKNIADMDSKYSIRVYELVKQYEKIGKRKIDIASLKAMVGAKTKGYQNFAIFRRDVLEIAKKEINTKSDLIIDFKEIREGRKVVAVEFKIKTKSKSNPYDYDGMTKRDLIKSIQSRMHDRTAETIHAVELFKYHRIILVELIEKFEKGAFEKVVIQHPKAFFKWHLDEINNMFDQERLFKEKKDY